MDSPKILHRLNSLNESETYSVLEILSKYDRSFLMTKEHVKIVKIAYKPDSSIIIYHKSNIVDKFQPWGHGSWTLAMNEVISFLRDLKINQLDLT